VLIDFNKTLPDLGKELVGLDMRRLHLCHEMDDFNKRMIGLSGLIVLIK